MITNRQMLLHAAVFIAFFAATVAVLQWRHVEQPKPRIMLNPSTLVQIEVPLGLMPTRERASQNDAEIEAEEDAVIAAPPVPAGRRRPRPKRRSDS